MDMNSRITDDVTKLFICFCEVAEPVSPDKEGWVIQKFPHDYDESGVLSAIPKFVYPCEFFKTTTVQHFSFVLTNINSKWTFGFCRHDPKTSTALVFLSFLPWQEVFTRMLNTVADLIRTCEVQDLNNFLEEVGKNDLPNPGTKLNIYLNDKIGSFNCNIPAAHALPTIPENRNLTEYYSAVDANNMIILFASMLNERRIVIKSRKLHRLSACVQAANTVLYPMSWQHIFIPLLPKQLADYLLAPMPFLIGVPTPTWDTVKKSDIGDIVLLDADTNVLETPFKDLEELPNDVVKMLKTQLKNQSAMLEDGFARTFLKALVQLIGGYRDALKFQQGKKITFSSEAFVESRPPSMQAFLRKILELQIFQQFIEERLEILNAGLGFSDEFEFEAYNYTVKSSSVINDQYNNWVSHMKKTGTAFYKTVKNKTNPAMRLAVKTVKERGKDVKSAYREIRTKIRKDVNSHDSEVSHSTFHRSRPLTVGGAPVPTTTYKKPRSTSVTTQNRSNEYVPLTSPMDDLASPLKEEESPAPRLDMDLLSDLQDVLNRQCSIMDSSPPVDRTLKPVRSLDDSIMDSYLAVRTTQASHIPFYAQSPTETWLNFPPSNPFASTLPSGPFDPFGFTSAQTTSVNPFLKANSFDLDCGNQRPVVKSTSLPIVLTASSSQRNGTDDLIQLEPAHNENSLSRDNSDDSIKFKTGLINPLYPYYTINNNAASSNSQNGIIEPPMKPFSDNLSFVHGPQGTRSQQYKQDMDLLKEYGIDFKAGTSGGPKTNNSTEPFDMLFDSTTKPNTPNNWATFD